MGFLNPIFDLLCAFATLRRVLEHDQRVRGDDTLFPDEQRVNVNLRDAIGMVGYEQRNTGQRVGQRGDVERGAPAIAGEQCRALHLIDHLARCLGVEGREAVGHIV